MAFPFVAPFDPWVKEVLQIRQKNPIISTLKSPFVVMTSGAKVIKNIGGLEATNQDGSKKTRIQVLKELLDPKNQKSLKDTYEGCIISNNVNNLALSYSHQVTTSGTPVGIDLNGKIITVEGETSRYVSTPIIESLEIDTDGPNNTLKEATVKVKCFTLKQLEMFELFFMKPGMNILIEFGDSSLLSGISKYQSDESKKNNKVYRNGKTAPVIAEATLEKLLIPKTNGADEFVKEFVQYFRSGLENSIRYFQKIESSLGSYDLIAGKVLSFSFSYEEDGTYDCTIKVSQSNQISLALPNTPPKKTSPNQKPPENPKLEYPEEDQILDSMVLNFGMDKEKLKKLLSTPHPEVDQNNSNLSEGNIKTWISKEIFNFVKLDTTSKDQKASSDAYVSLRFILKILMNYVLTEDSGGLQEDFFGLKIPKAIIEGKTREIIPIKIVDNFISSNENVIFPSSQLPKFKVSPPGEKNIKEEDRIVIDPKEKVDGRINGYDLNLPKQTKIELFYLASTREGKETKEDDIIKQTLESTTEVFGNALNIFVKYDEVVRIWNQELFRIDFLAKILDTINKCGYGVYQLIYAASDDSTSAVPSIIDLKLSNNIDSIIDTLNTPPFRFKLGPKDSIIRDFSFDFEMSNLVAAQSIYGNTKVLYEAASSSAAGEQQTTDVKDIVIPDKVYKSVDKGAMANADGWWAINYIDYSVSQYKLLDAKTTFKSLGTETQKYGVGTKPITEEEEEQQEVTTTEESVTDFIKGNTVFFQKSKTDTKTHLPLIYLDSNFIREKINIEKTEKNNASLTSITISFTVDGFSGFRSGYYFLIDGVPEIYNQQGQFQIGNVKHTLDNDGWKTTVEAQYLPRPVFSKAKT